MTRDNVFVLGLDERNRRALERLPEAEGMRFHALLSREQLQEEESLDFEARLSDARRILDEFDGTINAVIGYWDFPVPSMNAILCQEYGLPGPSLEGVLKCEHKYWSRLEQVEAAADVVPPFELVSLDDGTAEPPAGIRYPFWLKPVKSMSSKLAYRVDHERDFHRAVAEIDAEIDTFSRPFDAVLEHADLPDHIREIGGRACVAEEAAVGRQFTVEGYCTDEEVTSYGVIETVLYPGTSNFQRYEYPAPVTSDVADRLRDAARRVVRRVGLGRGMFNIEFFWDRESDTVRLLEINPRLSQSHTELVELVDGVGNFRAMVAVGLGRDPSMPDREGKYSIAGKFFPRVFEDGVVRDGPDAAEIQQIQRDIPGVVTIAPAVREGDHLADLTEQDPYSYALGDLVLGADDSAQLKVRYDACLDALGLVVEEVPEVDADA